MDLAHNISFDTIKKVVTESNHPVPSLNGSFLPASVIALLSFEKEPPSARIIKILTSLTDAVYDLSQDIFLYTPKMSD